VIRFGFFVALRHFIPYFPDELSFW